MNEPPIPFEQTHPAAAEILQAIFAAECTMSFHFDKHGGWSASKFSNRTGVFTATKPTLRLFNSPTMPVQP